VRPLSIEAEGFAAFRRRVAISFDDVDLFALVGPTGAGKSSVIDAMVFALYGKVPRYQDDRIVASVINVQSAEARVRLDFELEGERYTVVRVVRRTRTGASTKEARLEHGDEVLAGDARSLDEQVVALLGLTFEQFTKTVVLPQGEFARFLHERPADRQDLLVQLLDLGMYGRMASLARERARSCADRALVLDDELARLGDIDPDTEAMHRERAAALAALAEQAREVLAAIEALDRRLDEVRVEGEVLRVRQRALLAVAVPDGVHDHQAHCDKAAAVVTGAHQALDAARADLDAATTALAELPDDAELRDVARRWVRLAEREQALTSRRAAHDACAEAALVAGREAAAAHAVLTTAEQRLATAKDRARAAALRHELHEGRPCPVCEQTVLRLPAPVPDRELDDARGEESAARAAHERTAKARDRAQRELARADEEVASLVTELAVLQEGLAGAPDAASCAEALAAAAVARETETAARSAVKQAEAAARRAEQAARELDDLGRRLRRDLTAARDSIAQLSLQPPAPREVDLLEDWGQLVEWCAAAAAEVTVRIDALLAEHGELRRARDEHAAALAAACAAHGVDAAGPRLLEHCKQLETRALADADAAAERLARRTTLASQVDGLRADQRVAEDLGRLLGANGFQQWLLEEALDQLVTGASERMFSLSSGQFSLERDGKQFAVRDHRNADDLRPVKTLSGGETFLASLALALALADNVAALSAAGAPRLESIFLDEGFGSLDPETLDVVAAAIEELGASGRMVGVVTHIRELADRLPVRFEVTKLPDTSVVERVDK
jgi:exonuclease SbcC